MTQDITLGPTTSYWHGITKPVNYAPLTENIAVDVAIVGAGISGLSMAYRLIKLGKTVAVIDDGEIGGGQTSRTSGHLTCYVDGRLFDLIRLFGIEETRQIVQSHQQAIDTIENIIDEEEIDCDFKRINGYLFSERARDPWLMREAEALKEISILAYDWHEKAPFSSFTTPRCLKLPNQAQFHPLKYLYGLAEAFCKYGGVIFEDTHVDEIYDGTPCILSTSTGAKVSAQSVIVATHSPINDRVFIHTKQSQYQTYVIGALIPTGSVEEALYWDTGDPYHYLRIVPSQIPDHMILLIGGEDHRTGQKTNPERAFTALKKWMERRFFISDVMHQWSGQVVEPIDGVAFIGRNPNNRNVYVHTSPSGSGLTYALVAASVIPDLILTNSSPYETIYDPRRRTLKAFSQFFAENSNSLAQYADWFKGTRKKSLARNDGHVTRRGAHLVAEYKDGHGKCHALSAVCPHLGGIVRWNSVEKTWDCPCHGSRFSATGEVIAGPANANLSPIKKS